MSDVVFVSRNGGVITGVFANMQPGIATEGIADDHPDVVAFKAAASRVPSQAEITRQANLRGDANRVDLITRLNAATPAQINTYVDNNSIADAGTRLLIKKLFMVLAADNRT